MYGSFDVFISLRTASPEGLGSQNLMYYTAGYKET